MQLYVSSKRHRIYHISSAHFISTTNCPQHLSIAILASQQSLTSPITIHNTHDRDRVTATPPDLSSEPQRPIQTIFPALSIVQGSTQRPHLLRTIFRSGVRRSDSFLCSRRLARSSPHSDADTILIDISCHGNMQYQSTYATGMGTYEYDPVIPAGMWAESFKGDALMNTCPTTTLEVNIKFDNQSEGTSIGTFGYANQFDEEIAKPTDKVQRRLAQNREAARKCRLRKKGYVQHLETSRLRLKQLEQELDQSRQQGSYAVGGLVGNHTGFSGAVNSGLTAFEMDYGRWVETNSKQVTELRNALNAHQSDEGLQTLVDNVMKHYFELFQMKETAVKADVFYIMAGMWKTTAERFFLWIGGFRPSELLKILMPQLDPLAETQHLDICNLRRSCQQAEDALSQGIDRLQEIVVDTLAGGQMEDGSSVPQIAATMDKLGDLVSFVLQADHLRRETLNQMSEILTTHQTAKGLLALGDYLERLRALSSLWAKRPTEDA